MTTDSRERLEEALTAVEGATPGPWKYLDLDRHRGELVGESTTVAYGGWCNDSTADLCIAKEPDRAAIALASAIPAALRLAMAAGPLLEEIEEVRGGADGDPFGHCEEVVSFEAALSEFINLLPSTKSGDA